MNWLPCEKPQNNEVQFSSVCNAHGKWDERFFFVYVLFSQIAFLLLSFPIFHITNCTNTFCSALMIVWQTMCNDNDNVKVKSCMVKGFRDFTLNLDDFLNSFESFSTNPMELFLRATQSSPKWLHLPQNYQWNKLTNRATTNLPFTQIYGFSLFSWVWSGIGIVYLTVPMKTKDSILSPSFVYFHRITILILTSIVHWKWMVTTKA